MWSHKPAQLVFLQLWIARASCFVNVAYTPAQGLQGQATMSEDPFPNTQWTADKVVDGNANQTAIGGSCAMMDYNHQYKSVWLKVNLSRRFSVAYIELYLRNEHRRSSGFSIYAFYDDTFDPASLSPNDFAYHHDPLSGCPTPVQNITINRLVRQIVFINSRPDGFQTKCTESCNTGRYATGCIGECPSGKFKNCDAFNGSCIDKCPDPNALTEECIVCADGRYISNGYCVKCKGHCKNDEHCNKLTGECDSGCASQWTGSFCDQCIDHFYGRDCRTQCGHCINNEACEKVTGECPNGCMPHWQINKCDMCSDHFSGIDCTTPCGHCINNNVCDNVTGQCPNGCQNHWTGNRCDVCVDHYYGIDCNTPCGKCKNNSVCNKGTGHCPNGCQNHWTGNKCDVCRDNFYGGDCNTSCGHCINADMCNTVTGQCSNGCQYHWTGDRCDVCSEYIYGTDCNTPCGHCKDKDVCDNTTGHCPNGCQNQWTGDRCEECVPYKYGPNCAFDCGHCKDGKSCVAKTGVCTDGCESGWIGDLCIKAELNAPDFETNKNKLITTGVAIIASVSTLFAISLFVIFFMARHIMKNKSKRHHNNEYVPKNEKPPQTYVDLSTVDDNHAYSTLGSTVPETPYNVIGN